MQLSRPLLILPLFFRQKIAFFTEKIFCSKRPLFLCLAVFFSLLVLFFFCSDDDVWCGVFFFLSAFFFAFLFAFFSLWGVSFRQHRRKEKETNEKI